MSDTLIRWFENDFSAARSFGNVALEVEEMTWHAVGGPETALLRATGPAHALVEMANHLRAPLEIWDRVAGAVWWGYLARIEIVLGGVAVSVALDGMANRIAVVYTLAAPGTGAVGKHATTAWAQDAESIAAYGTKEWLESLSESSASQADQFRDNLLAVLKYPVTAIRHLAEPAPVCARLVARGWWETLSWKYYTKSSDTIEGAPGTPNAEVHLGDNSESLVKGALAQAFQFTGGSTWHAETISLWVDKSAASVAHSLTAALCAYSTAGSPGQVLASATRTSSEIVWGDWNEFTLGTRVALTDGAWYWVMVSVNGEGATWYALRCKSGGSTVLRVQNWTGGAWSDASPACELKYRIGCVRENAEEVQSAIQTSGQFLNGVDVDATSGLYSNSYRDGEASCRRVVEDLLRAGTVNGHALLAEVGRNRRVRLSEEPTPPLAGGTALRMDARGHLSDEYGQPWPRRVSPVGRWCIVRQAALALFDRTRLADPATFFIERSQYTAATRRLSVQARNLENL